jgi:hypothetical protein
VAKIVCVHGIKQQFKGESTTHSEWFPSLRDGIRLNGRVGRDTASSLTEADLRIAFYGDVFRPQGQTLGVGDPWLGPEDLTAFEQSLLDAWWRETARIDQAVLEPGDLTMGRTPRTVQAALRAISGSAFFSGMSERMLLGDLVQVRRYFTEPDVRAAAQQRVADAVDDETQVLVGHSLGSVVAYEALCANPEWRVKALVTLGSPLGIRNLIFDRLLPPPDRSASRMGHPRGQWPGIEVQWTNVADEGDVVALVKDLRPLFGDEVVSNRVHNGAAAHDIRPYLTAPETGMAILTGLTGTEAPE